MRTYIQKTSQNSSAQEVPMQMKSQDFSPPPQSQAKTSPEVAESPQTSENTHKSQANLYVPISRYNPPEDRLSTQELMQAKWESIVQRVKNGAVTQQPNYGYTPMRGSAENVMQRKREEMVQRIKENRATQANKALAIATPSDRYDQTKHGAGEKVVDKISTVNNAPLQRAYELNINGESDVTKKIEDGKAKEVLVKNIQGDSLGAAANSPTVEPFGWDELKKAGHTLRNASGKNSHYNAVRMHLWNGRLGGPGNEIWNLAPGPAKVNSMMSAGPETAAKNLVDSGKKIWLHTVVSYARNSSNANDFMAVVPNHIEMRSGLMENTKPSHEWIQDIELPVAALDGLAAKEYEDWDEKKPNELVNKLKTQTGQVRAQAFDLVKHDQLKLAILLEFPDTYYSMTMKAKGEILQAFQKLNELENFWKNGLKIIDPEILVEEVLLPLAAVNELTTLQTIFKNLGEPIQRKAIVRYHAELLTYLGDIGLAWSKKDILVFGYNSDLKQSQLLELMNQSEISNLLENTTALDRKAIFNNWALYQGSIILTAKSDFIDKKDTVKDGWKETYKNQIQAEIKSNEYNSGRPSRDRKQTKKPDIKFSGSRIKKPVHGKVRKALMGKNNLNKNKLIVKKKTI
jgi:hypothetical protein